MDSMKSTCYPCWFHWRTSFCAIDFIPVLWSISIFYRLLGFIMFYWIPSPCILASFVLLHSTFSPLMFCSTCLFHSLLFHCNNYSSIFLFHFQVSSVWFSSLLRCLQSSLFCTVPLVIFDTLNSSCLNAFLPLCVCVCDFNCSCKLTQCTSARPWYYQALTWKDWGREAVSMQCTLCSCTKIYVKCDGSAECAIVSQRITARFKVFHV